MKTIYIKRNSLFKDIEMLLCNNITEVDENFLENNYDMFYADTDEDDVNEEIDRLCSVDWSHEEYKPYDITDKMNEKELRKHLEDFKDDIMIDLEPSPLEPYQYFLTSLDDWTKKRLESFGVNVGYSEKLDLHVIAIYDYGTSWSMFSYSKEVDDDYKIALEETEALQTVY